MITVEVPGGVTSDGIHQSVPYGPAAEMYVHIDDVYSGVDSPIKHLDVFQGAPLRLRG